MNGWLLVLIAVDGFVAIVLLAVELDRWRDRRRPPGAGALRDQYERASTPDRGDPVDRLRGRW